MFLAVLLLHAHADPPGAQDARHPGRYNPDYRSQQRLLEPRSVPTKAGSGASRVLSLLVVHPAFSDESTRPWTNGVSRCSWTECAPI